MAKGTVSKWGRIAERTGGEPEVQRQFTVLNSLDAGIGRVQRRTLPMLASNEPRRSKVVFLVFWPWLSVG